MSTKQVTLFGGTGLIGGFLLDLLLARFSKTLLLPFLEQEVLGFVVVQDPSAWDCFF